VGALGRALADLRGPTRDATTAIDGQKDVQDDLTNAMRRRGSPGEKGIPSGVFGGKRWW